MMLPITRKRKAKENPKTAIPVQSENNIT